MNRVVNKMHYLCKINLCYEEISISIPDESVFILDKSKFPTAKIEYK